MRISNRATLEKYNKFQEVFLSPSTTVVSQKTKICRSSLSSFLHGKRNLSEENLDILNKFIDEKLSLVIKEKVES